MPLERAMGAKAAGESNDRRAVPSLVDRLDDEDAAVRMYSILALERITGTRLGYDYAARREQRLAAIRQWRYAIRTGELTVASSQPAADQTRGRTNGWEERVAE